MKRSLKKAGKKIQENLDRLTGTGYFVVSPPIGGLITVVDDVGVAATKDALDLARQLQAADPDWDDSAETNSPGFVAAWAAIDAAKDRASRKTAGQGLGL